MDRALDGAKEGDRKRAIQQVETDARLLQLIETIRAASGGKLPYAYFDEEIQNIRDINGTYETQRKKDPQGAQRVRDAKIAGMLANLDYRKVREIDETLLETYVLPALEEEESLGAVAQILAIDSTAAPDSYDLGGLDILDGVTDDIGISQVSLLPIYRLLATTNEDEDVVLPTASDSPGQKMTKQAFTAAVQKALTAAIDVKELDSKGKDELRSPMRHMSMAAASCDRTRDALNAVAQHQLFDVNKLQTAYEDYMRSHDELLMALKRVGVCADGTGDDR